MASTKTRLLKHDFPVHGKEEGNGRCIAILFKSIGVRGRFDSPANGVTHLVTHAIAITNR